MTRTAVSPATSLHIEPSAWSSGMPWRAIQAARQVSSRAASTEACMSASMNATPWFCPIGRPNWTRSRAYSVAYSTAARATPTAIAATLGPGRLERLHRGLLAAAAALPDPGQPGVQPVLAADQAAAGHPHAVQHDLGRVRGPDAVLAELLPLGQAPAVPGGTMKLAWPRLPSAGSTEATTTCTLAMPPLVAQVLVPFSTHSSVASS